MKKYLALLSFLGVVGFGMYIGIHWYSYLFARNVEGVVYGVERVEAPLAVMTDSARPSQQVFSFAVAVKDSRTGEIYTASSEDRRWAVVQKGQCAEAKFLPYPPWSLSRSGAYFGARLIRLYECPPNAPQPAPSNGGGDGKVTPTKELKQETDSD